MAPLNGVYRGPCGVYAQNAVTSGGAQSGITAYAAFLGKPVSYVLDYQTATPSTWAQFTGCTLYKPITSYTTLNTWGALSGGRIMMLGLTACAGRATGTGGTTWAAEAAGVNDANWTTLGNNLVTWGYSNAYLRIGREFNYGGYVWSPSTTGDSQASYIAGYQHIVTLLKGIAGNSFKFMWNPALGTMAGQAAGHPASDVQNWYPGDSYVDSIGLDAYDWGNYPPQAAAPWGNRTLAQQQSNFAYLTNAQDGLAGWNVFAQAHGKQLAFPEWGLQQWLQGGTYIGGGDDPYYVTAMVNEMASSCLMQAMWEDPGMGVFDTDAYAGRTASLQAPDASRSTFLFYFGAGNTGSGGIPYSGAGSLTGNLEERIATAVAPPGTPPGPSGGGGTAPSAAGAGWEIFVRSYADYTTLLCQIPTKVYTQFQFVKMLNDIGSASVTLNMDDSWWKSAVMGDGSTANTILDFECLWQFSQDGVPRFEMLGETITEQLIDASESRLVTVTGPGTAAALKWARAMPAGFPNIVLKLDGLADSFGAVAANGSGVVDPSIWNILQPAASIFITPVPSAYTYPGGSAYSLSALFSSGTLTIQGTPATTLLGSTPWDMTDTLVSLQIIPLGAPSGNATDANGNPIAYGTGLDGSELTQVYVESLNATGYNAGFGLSATQFYVWNSDPVSGYQTHIISSATAYSLSSYAYWMITEQAGTGGGSGTFYFWTSADGSTWTQQWTVVHNWDARYVGFFVAARYGSAGQSAVIQSVNSNVTVRSYQGNVFLNEPIVGIWKNLLTTAQARGTIPFVSTLATAAADSFGNPWTDVQNCQITNGTDLYSLLQSACATVNADFVMQPGFVVQVGLEVSGSITLGTDRSQQIVFREARDELAKQRVRTRGAIQNSIGAENSDGREISANSASSISQWGQREGWYQTAAQVDPASMEIAAAAAVGKDSTEILSWTLSILPGVTGKTVFESFDVGDWVGLECPDFSATDAVRVIGIAVAVDQAGVETNELTLLSYIQWLQEQLTYINSKLGGAFVNALGTTPVPAGSKYGIGQLPTYFSPASALGNLADVIGTGGRGGSPLVYNSATGKWQPASSADPVSGTVLPVTIAGAGGTVQVSSTGVAISAAPSAVAPDGGGAPPAGATVVHTPAGTVIKDATGSTRVVIGQQGDGTVTVVESNGAPPAAPDVPVVTAGVLGVVVGWDGLLGAAAPLADFRQAEVHVSTSAGFTPSSATLRGTMTVGGLFGVGSLTAGTTYYVKLLARNKSGVAGAASTQASGVPLAVGAAAIATGSITSAQIASAANILGSQLAANTITAGQIAANTITASQLAAGIIYAGIVDATTLTGAQFIATGTQGELLIYNGVPGSGNLAGSWSGTAGADLHGNTYPAGISASAGTFLGSGMTGADITSSTFTAGSVTSCSISNPAVSGGTISETQITFDQVGGRLLVYSSTTTTVTLTSGSSWTGPAGSYTQGKVECWGGDASGGGGTTSYGGEGGGGAAYACEPNYPLRPGGVYSTQFGPGGTGVLTSNTGQDGGQTAFDGGGVVAYAGRAGSSGTGGLGGGISGNTISYPGGNGGNGLLGVASAGGGGRAGSAGPGGNGGPGGASPGAAGAAGSGTGGHAGGAGAASGTAGNTGGGGSGAGKGGAGTTYQTLFYDATSTASYYGTGYPGWSAGSLKNTNGSMFQGCASGYIYVTGDQVSFANYNASQMASDWSGWTIDWVALTVNNQGSWYSTGCYAVLGYVAPGNVYNQQAFWCDSGTVTDVDVSGILSSRIGSLTALIFGPSYYTSGGSINPYNYGYFQGGAGPGSPRITVGGHQGTGGSFRSGAGAGGVIKITYVSGTPVLIGAIAPAAGTDAGGNAYGAGLTGFNQAFTPGASPATVETWHTVTYLNGWAANSGVQLAYKLKSDNTVLLAGRVVIPGTLGTGPAGSAICTLPVGYRPANRAETIYAVNVGAGGYSSFETIVQITTGGAVTCYWATSPPAGTLIISGTYPLDAPA